MNITLEQLLTQESIKLPNGNVLTFDMVNNSLYIDHRCEISSDSLDTLYIESVHPMKTVQIPFGGFYESCHSHAIENVVDRDCDDIDYDQEIDFNYTKPVLEGYCKLYLNAVERELNENNMLELSIEFKELVSPKEYNFETDRIFATISNNDLIQLFMRVDRDILRSTIKDQCTSYDGFICRYSNNLDDWPQNVLEWDSVQLCFLFEVLLYSNDSFEYDSVNDENGELSELVWEGYSENSKKLIESTRQ